MARLLSTWFNGFIGSAKKTGKLIEDAFGKKVPEMVEHYASDFGGHGWKLQEDENGKYILELDSLKIRESLIAHELIIDQIRAICGSLGISQACGKVKEVQSDSTNYYLIMEGEETHGYGGFMANDFIRCQRWTGNGLKGYWVKITSITSKNGGSNNTLVIAKSEFKGVINQDDGTNSDNVSVSTSSMSLPSAGDDVVQYGNETDTTRQSAIYIHANGTGQPALDILTGIHSKSFDGCLACRLGGDLPNGGFGLYSKNGRVFSQSESGEMHYTLNPDGTFSLGKGAIVYDGKGTVTIGSNVVIKWGAQSQSKYEWAISSNGTSAPTDWSSIEPTNVAQGMYIWKRTTYPDGTETTELIGFVGKNGVNGKDAASNYEYAVSNSGTSAPTEDWGTSVPTNVAQGMYIWRRIKDDKGNVVTTELLGFVGKDGAQNVSYFLLSSPSAVTKKEDGTYTSTYINVKAYKTIGEATSEYTNVGNIAWRVYSADGTTIAKNGSGSIASLLNVENATRIEFELSVDGVSVAKIAIPIVWNGEGGKDGEDAISYSLQASNDFVLRTQETYNSAPTFDPQSITVKAYKSKGSDFTEYTDGTISYTIYGSSSVLKIGNGKTITISDYPTAKQITFTLNVNGVVVAQKDIAIIKNGINGDNGDDGASYYILAPVGSISRTAQSGSTPSYSQESITVEAYRTLGLNSSKFTGGTMKWYVYGTDGTTVKSSGTGNTATLGNNRYLTRIEFKLFVNDVEVAQKTIPIVWNGTNGTNGKDGADGTSQHNNLLVHTDFSPKAENYAGTYLKFQSSLATISGTLTESAATGETDMLSASVTGMTDIFRYDVTKLLKSSTWYVIGITMRGSGTATVYCYPNSNESTIYVDGRALGSPSDASNAFTLTSSWRRHYIAFQTKADLSGSKYVLVRLSGTTNADIAMVTIGRPYGGGTDLNADGYIQNGLQLIRMATPSEMETFQGINSLCTWRSSQRDFDFYSQNLSSALMAGEWYTLSFYTRGSGKLSTFIYQYGGQVLSGESADMPLADGVKETTFKNDGSHVWDLSSDWVRHIYTFRVREDGSFSVPILLFRATSGTSNQFIAINQVKLEHGKNASDWCLNEMDKKAVSLPDWMKAFNGYTMLGDDYIASGNAFFGKKESDGIYTGCMMSSNSLQIGGNTVVGMYAIERNVLKVAIDPVGQKYYFKGSVYADEGVFNGTVYADKGVFNGITTGMQLNSVTNINTSNWSNYLELRTKDITGVTTKLYTKYAYPKIQNLSSIIYVNSLPETTTEADGSDKVTKYYRRWQLPPYGDSDEEIQQALSLVGCKLIIYNNMTDTNEVGKGFQLYGRFFKTGETEFKTYLSLSKGMVVLTMCIGTDGQFYWQYDGAIENLTFNGTLKPGTGWVFERDNVSGGLTQ